MPANIKTAKDIEVRDAFAQRIDEASRMMLLGEIDRCRTILKDVLSEIAKEGGC